MRTSAFDEYLALYEKRQFREAYRVLCEIMQKDPQWSHSGDLYVWCAELEMLINDDAPKALRLLEKAGKLGCRHLDVYYNTRGFVRWRLGERTQGIRDLEKSVELVPSVRNLVTLGACRKTCCRDRHSSLVSILVRLSRCSIAQGGASVSAGLSAKTFFRRSKRRPKAGSKSRFRPVGPGSRCGTASGGCG